MKKILNFLRSMRFGIVLLLLIAICSLAGSLIPQGREMAWYVENYPKFHVMLFILRLDKVFTNWYFMLMMLLLAVNLTLCSLVRIGTVIKSGRTLHARAAILNNTIHLNSAQLDILETFLMGRGCKKRNFGTTRIYTKNLFGRYGSFITHLSILLTLTLGAAGLYLPQVTDQNCLPGESVTMPDGTEIAVHSFYIENDSGQLDFTSDISIILGKNGHRRDGNISVNHPLSNGPYKIYQQTFGTAGKITVTNLETKGSDSFVLNEAAFLSLDGTNGVWYMGLYPDYYKDPDGTIHPITETFGRYENPIYSLQLSEDGVTIPDIAFPGESLQLGGLEYRFEEAVEYPGLRIKYTPPAVNALLFASFALMIIGLYILFFMQPVIVKVDDQGCAISGPKPEGMRMDIQALLENHKKEGSHT